MTVAAFVAGVDPDRLTLDEVARALVRAYPASGHFTLLHGVKREDEHDIKLAYSCWREWQHRGDDLYRRAASARVA